MVRFSSNARSATPSGPDPAALLELRDLELRVRAVMEGMRLGLHRSPYRGHSVEFAEYRPYTPGDDLRRLDWRVLARTDRLYLRQHDEDTNLRCWLMLDASRSMAFGSRPVATKMAYARTLAATLAAVLQRQGDVVGLIPFDEQLRQVVPPSQRPGHLRRLFGAIERQPVDGRTALGGALSAAARLLRRRSLLVIVSDFLNPPEEWQAALAELAASGHDLRAIQVLDPAEPELEGLDQTALWEDLETGQTRYIDPQKARTGYRLRFNHHLEAIRATFQQLGVLHFPVLTDQPLGRALHRVLATAPRALRRAHRQTRA